MRVNNLFGNTRRFCGVPQRKIAEACDVAVSTVCHWEAGRYLPTEKQARIIARLLNTPANVLFPELYQEDADG